MLSAGIEIGMDCINDSNLVRDQKVDFVVLKVKDKKMVQCITKYPESESDIELRKNDHDKYQGWAHRVYPELVQTLKDQNEPLYVILDVKCMTKDSRKSSKLYFIGWCPEESGVREKMLFASTFTQLANTLNISVRITAHSISDLGYQDLLNYSR